MDYDLLKKRIDIISERIKAIGGEVLELKIEKPASVEEIKDVENKLGVGLPKSFKNTLLEFSSNFSFRWFFPDDFELPDELDGIFSGTPHWGIDLIPGFEESRKRWIKNQFSDPNDRYDAVWHNKLSFFRVGNGDFIAFDLNYHDDPPVIYLSHDGGEGHGYKLGDNFEDFINKWSRVAFVGGEVSQWIPFTENSSSGIVPDGEAAVEFREKLKLDM